MFNNCVRKTRSLHGSILNTLPKTQDQIDERLQHKTIYTERDRREKEEQPFYHWPRRRSEQHTNSKAIRSTISNWDPMNLVGTRSYFAGS